MLSPVLKRIADDPSARAGSGWPLDLVTVDIDQQLKLAQKYEVSLTLRSMTKPY